jgi:hypothetical protein
MPGLGQTLHDEAWISGYLNPPAIWVLKQRAPAIFLRAAFHGLFAIEV